MVYDKPICCAARDSYTPGGGIRNANRSRSRERYCKQKKVAGLWRTREIALTSSLMAILGSSQISAEVVRTPVLNYDRKDRQNRYGEQVVVKHGIPIGKSGGFDSFAHRKHLRKQGVRGGTVVTTSQDHIGSSCSAVDHHPEVANIQVPHGVGDSGKVD